MQAITVQPPDLQQAAEPPQETDGSEDKIPSGQLKKVTATAVPDVDMEIKSHSGKFKLHVPEEAVDEEVDIEITEIGPVPSRNRLSGCL